MTDYSELRQHLDAGRPWLDPMTWALVDDAEAEVARLTAERDEAREELAESERMRDSLRLERDGLEHVRRKDNAYLLDARDEARAQADELAKALAGVIRDAEASGNFPRIQHTATLIAYQRSQDRP